MTDSVSKPTKIDTYSENFYSMNKGKEDKDSLKVSKETMISFKNIPSDSSI
jgi:hypothetical protein